MLPVQWSSFEKAETWQLVQCNNIIDFALNLCKPGKIDVTSAMSD